MVSVARKVDGGVVSHLAKGTSGEPTNHEELSPNSVRRAQSAEGWAIVGGVGIKDAGRDWVRQAFRRAIP